MCDDDAELTTKSTVVVQDLTQHFFEYATWVSYALILDCMAKSFSLFSFNVLFQAWGYAEQDVVMAERQWLCALVRTGTDSEEAVLSKSQLLDARKFSVWIFRETMAAAKS